MKNLLFTIAVGAIGAICLFSKPLFAAQTSNGIEYTKDAFGTYYYPYSSFSLSSLWGTTTGHTGQIVYNSAGGTSTTAGWIDVRPFGRGGTVEIKTVGWNNSGTMTVYVEGRLGTTTTGSGTTLISVTVNATGNKIRSIEENVDWIRFGQTLTAIGTESVSIIYKQ